MKCRVFGIFWLFGVVVSTKVEIQSEWKEDFGWQITCTWTLYSNDSLQSVRLYNNVQQFMIYRPESDGPQRTQLFSLPDNHLEVDCSEKVPTGMIGKCVLNLELYQPQKEDLNYSCEVSGERPYFRMHKKDIVVPALVMPSPASITAKHEPSGSVTLNCTSSGVPAPELVWSIDDRREPKAFSGSYWNFTSKLWNVWSQITYSPSDKVATCNPSLRRPEKSYSGLPAVYNTGKMTSTSTFGLSIAFLLVLLS